VSSRKKKGEKRVGVGGRGKYPGAPPHHLNKKRGEEARSGERECYKKKILPAVRKINLKHQIFFNFRI
jgi:hypothetical protein